MVIDTFPAAVGVDRYADVRHIGIGNKVADSTVAGLGDKACFGAHHFAAGFFIFNAAHKPVGDGKPFRMFGGGSSGIDPGVQNLPAEIILQCSFHNHRHVVCGTVMILVVQSDTVGEVCGV